MPRYASRRRRSFRSKPRTHRRKSLRRSSRRSYGSHRSVMRRSRLGGRRSRFPRRLGRRGLNKVTTVSNWKSFAWKGRSAHRRAKKPSRSFIQKVATATKNPLVFDNSARTHVSWNVDSCVFLSPGIGYNAQHDNLFNTAIRSSLQGLTENVALDAAATPAKLHCHVDKSYNHIEIANAATAAIEIECWECFLRHDLGVTAVVDPSSIIATFGSATDAPDVSTTLMPTDDYRYTPFMCGALVLNYALKRRGTYVLQPASQMDFWLNQDNYDIKAVGDTTTSFVDSNYSARKGKAKFLLFKFRGRFGVSLDPLVGIPSGGVQTQGSVVVRQNYRAEFHCYDNERKVRDEPTILRGVTPAITYAFLPTTATLTTVLDA